MSNRVKKILNNPEALFLTLAYRGFFNWMSDERYLKIAYWCKIHKKLNLDEPKTFNEKLQWLKLHDRRPVYQTMVDKYDVKAYVSKLIGEKYVVPTLGVYDSFQDINFDALPSQFVIKCTHDSGSIAICRDKESFNKAKAKQIIEKGLRHNPYWAAREWPYKHIRPRIIIEQYLSEEGSQDLKDYKFFCFNGEVRCFKIDLDRFSYHRANYYDCDCNILPFGEIAYPADYEREIEFPENIKEMMMLAERLAKDTIFSRVDFYNVNGQIYFGEITFFPAGGFGIIKPDEWDKRLGDWISI